MNPYVAAMLFSAGLAVILVALGPSLFPVPVQRSLASLFIGVFTGFVTIPMPMLIPFAVALGVALGITYVRGERHRDVGLMLAGAGAVWTALWGWNAWNAATDRAVTAPGVEVHLATGVALLLAGLAVVALATGRSRHG